MTISPSKPLATNRRKVTALLVASLALFLYTGCLRSAFMWEEESGQVIEMGSLEINDDTGVQSIDEPLETHVYTLYGTQDQLLHVVLESKSDISLILSIIPPDSYEYLEWNVKEYGDHRGDNLDVRTTLPVDGTYKVIIGILEGKTGSYSLRIEGS